MFHSVLVLVWLHLYVYVIGSVYLRFNVQVRVHNVMPVCVIMYQWGIRMHLCITPVYVSVYACLLKCASVSMRIRVCASVVTCTHGHACVVMMDTVSYPHK